MSNHNIRNLFIVTATAITVVVFGLFVSTRTNNRGNIRVKDTELLMGTIVEIEADGKDMWEIKKAIDNAFSEMRRLEAIMSSYRKDSEVSLIERDAPEWVRVSPELLELLEDSLKISRLTNGAFDITVGVMGRVWNFTPGREKVPDKKSIEQLLPLIDYRDIEIDKKASSVRLKKKGMEITLGGIAKGYIVDRAMDVLESYGIDTALINAGGDIKVIDRDGEKPWHIGVQHPRKKGSIIARLTISNGSVATSGDYERYFIKDGRRYHHILDPRTGMPAEGLEGVTIVAPDSYYSDAIATAVFVLGKQRGKELIESLKDVEGIIIDNNGGIWISPDLKNKVELMD